MNEKKLTDIGYIKELMEESGVVFQKRFGQNFIVNPHLPERITAYTGKYALEIGPGIGVLTRELALRAERVVAVEIDRGLIEVLRRTLSDCQNVTVINEDILQTDLLELAKNHFGGEAPSICANLPYNITTPVIMKLLECGLKFDGIVVMVQNEVCDRFCAPPGSPQYNAVSAIVSYYAKAERLFRVSAGCFLPRPKVESAVMRFTQYDTPPADVENERFFIFCIKSAFGQRRKTLCNALTAAGGFSGKTFTREDVLMSLRECKLDENIRGEKLGVEEFASFSNALFKTMCKNQKNIIK